MEQVMEQAAVAEVNPLGFDQALADIAEEGWQATNQKDSFEQVQAMLDGVIADPEGIAESRKIEQATLLAGEHGEQAAQKECVRAEAIAGEIAL